MSSTTSSAGITAAVRDQLFADARTVNTFTDEAVGVDLVREVYEAVRWAPTAMNCQPLRLAVVESATARERLVAHMRPGNQPKTLAAPLTLVAAYDPGFHEHMATLTPHRPEMREKLAPDVEFRESTARFNGILQVGYLVLGLRGAGLHVGPMTGFDAAAIDEELFAGSGWRTLVVLNVGHAPSGDEGDMRPRAARLGFDDAAVVL